MKVAYITAGAGGMYCGSCMHDNTLASALARQGVDIQLIPLYTPIRTDEDDFSIDRVFFGGINVYLQQKIPLFRWLPSLLDRWFDSPRLIRWATAGAGDTSPKELGSLAVSMLKGTSGYQRKEVRKLCTWLAKSVQPHLVTLTNMLIAGCVPAIKESLGIPVLVTLQGDDVFLDDLIEPYKSQAFEEIHTLVDYVDGFIVNTRYYADLMSEYFKIPPEKFRIVPLGIDTTDFQQFADSDASDRRNGEPPTIGYLARLAPEKGLHVLVDAFINLRLREEMQDARLKIAGWLGEKNRGYVETEFAKLRNAGLDAAFEYIGEVDRSGKIDFLSRIDVLSVPSVYQDPKGLYVLEALAAGVPAVQPSHGAFPELSERWQGCGLVPAEDPDALANELHRLLMDRQMIGELGQAGCRRIHESGNADVMATAMVDVYRAFTRS